MRRRLVYTTDKLDELPVGTIVQGHRDLAVDPNVVTILVRQPRGWFAGWGWDVEVDPKDVVPCTIVTAPTGDITPGQR